MQPTHESVLTEAIRLTSHDRHNVYGDAHHDFERIGRVWAALLDVPHIPAHTVAAMLAGMKLVRTQLAEGTNHRDSWVDAAAYPALGWHCVVRDNDRIGPPDH